MDRRRVVQLREAIMEALKSKSEVSDVGNPSDLNRLDKRDAAMKGYYVASKKFGVPKIGADIDFYHPSNGDKVYGKVVNKTNSHIHIQQEKNGTWSGKVHKMKIHIDPNE